MTSKINLRVALAIFAVDAEYASHDWNSLKQQEKDAFMRMAQAAINELDKRPIGFYGVQLT